MQIKTVAILWGMLLTDLMKLTPRSRIPVTHLVQEFPTVFMELLDMWLCLWILMLVSVLS